MRLINSYLDPTLDVTGSIKQYKLERLEFANALCERVLFYVIKGKLYNILICFISVFSVDFLNLV